MALSIIYRASKTTQELYTAHQVVEKKGPSYISRRTSARSNELANIPAVKVHPKIRAAYRVLLRQKR